MRQMIFLSIRTKRPYGGAIQTSDNTNIIVFGSTYRSYHFWWWRVSNKPWVHVVLVLVNVKLWTYLKALKARMVSLRIVEMALQGCEVELQTRRMVADLVLFYFQRLHWAWHTALKPNKLNLRATLNNGLCLHGRNLCHFWVFACKWIGTFNSVAISAGSISPAY